MAGCKKMRAEGGKEKRKKKRKEKEKGGKKGDQNVCFLLSVRMFFHMRSGHFYNI